MSATTSHWSPTWTSSLSRSLPSPARFVRRSSHGLVRLAGLLLDADICLTSVGFEDGREIDDGRILWVGHPITQCVALRHACPASTRPSSAMRQRLLVGVRWRRNRVLPQRLCDGMQVRGHRRAGLGRPVMALGGVGELWPRSRAAVPVRPGLTRDGEPEVDEGTTDLGDHVMRAVLVSRDHDTGDPVVRDGAVGVVGLGHHRVHPLQHQLCER
jgi:hypothetical protein